MQIKIKKKSPGATEKLIKNFECKTGITLPPEFKNFIKKHNGCIPETNAFEFDGNSSDLNEFLSLEEIQKSKELLIGRVRDVTLPFADAEGGNLVCFNFESGSPIITFWDHETENEISLASNFVTSLITSKSLM